jgi:hypothetical protein
MKATLSKKEKELLLNLETIAWQRMFPDEEIPARTPERKILIRGHTCWIAADWIKRLRQVTIEHTLLIEKLRKRIKIIREQAKEF